MMGPSLRLDIPRVAHQHQERGRSPGWAPGSLLALERCAKRAQTRTIAVPG